MAALLQPTSLKAQSLFLPRLNLTAQSSQSPRFVRSAGVVRAQKTGDTSSKSPVDAAIQGASALLLAGALLLTPPSGDALAAQSGGRVGGSGFAASRARAPPPAPARSSTRNQPSRASPAPSLSSRAAPSKARPPAAIRSPPTAKGKPGQRAEVPSSSAVPGAGRRVGTTVAGQQSGGSGGGRPGPVAEQKLVAPVPQVLQQQRSGTALRRVAPQQPQQQLPQTRGAEGRPSRNVTAFSSSTAITTNVIVAPSVVSPVVVAPTPFFGGWGFGGFGYAPVVSVGFGFNSFLFFFELFAGLFAFIWVWGFISNIFNRRD